MPHPTARLWPIADSPVLAERAGLLAGGDHHDAGVRHGLARLAWNMALQDWLILAFHLALWCLALLAPDGPHATRARAGATGLLGMTLLMLGLCRGELLPPGRLRAILYRVLAIAGVFLSYFEMGALLPALQPRLVDAGLLAIDEALLGTTPAVALQAWLTPATAAWFSFFYCSYAWLLPLNLIGAAALDRDRRRLHELLLAGTIVGVVGHLLYTLVPAAGPCVHLSFAEPIPDGFWWRQVRGLVNEAGALLDVFPSLHTAFPSLFALHALRHRRTMPYRILWPGAVFFATNIVISTMFLRWHYAIDVFAGLALAAVAQRIAVVVAAREPARRRAGCQGSFEDVSRTPR